MPEEQAACIEGPIGIAGAGRMAQALGRLLRERGEAVAAVASRHSERAGQAAAFIGSVKAVAYSELPSRATRVLIAVADAAIADVAWILARAGMHGGAALHTCGGFGPEVLAPLAAQGVATGTIHPLQTVASPEQGVHTLPGAAFAIDGEPAALEWAERIAGILEGVTLRIPAARRPLYHAAAVFASNCAVGLADAAVILMTAAGIDEPKALQAIGPLMRASVANALDMGPVAALTGPVLRGDADTVSAHLKALAGAPESVRALYRAAGLHVLGMARRRGLAEQQARPIEKILQDISDPDA